MKNKNKLENEIEISKYLKSLEKLQDIDVSKAIFGYLISRVSDKDAIKVVKEYVSKDKALREECDFYKTPKISQFFWPELLYAFRRNLKNTYELLKDLYSLAESKK